MWVDIYGRAERFACVIWKHAIRQGRRSGRGRSQTEDRAVSVPIGDLLLGVKINASMERYLGVVVVVCVGEPRSLPV